MKSYYILFTVFFLSFNPKILGQTEGSLDNTFNTGSGFNDLVKDIEVQSDGKILVGGTFTTYQNVSANSIIRLNSDGSIDNTFVYSTGFNSYVSDILIQPDGKIIIVGYFSTYKSVSSNRIVRLNNDGSIDNSFSSISGGTSLYIKNIEIQNDLKLLISRVFTNSGGLVLYNDIVRLNINGTIDNTFSTGTGFDASIETFKIGLDDKIYVAGSFLTYKSTTLGTKRIIRLNSDGTRDSTFANGATGFNDSVLTINLQSKGKIFAGGIFSQFMQAGNLTSPNNITKLTSDGRIDPPSFMDGFQKNSGVIVRDLAIQNDNKILVVGSFSTYNSISNINNIVRINDDSKLSFDETFNTGNGFNSNVTKVKIQANGAILVGGNFTKFNSTTANRIIRLNGTPILSTEQFENEKIIIYPNPVKETLYISHIENTDYEVYDILGKLILKGKTVDNKINVTSLKNGIYILKLKKEKNTINQKFVKE
jgi:uncharacterized delta-60 repeat protein